MSGPLDPLVLLRQRVEAALTERGLETVEVMILPPSTTAGTHEICVFATLAERPASSACADEFEDVIRSARQAEIEQRAASTLEELTQRLNNDGGFLGPDT